MRFIKVSSKKYEARDQGDCVRFTIKRSNQRYIVRANGGCPDTYIIFDTLPDAKEYIRKHSSVKKKGWIDFFVRHTRGLSFGSQEQSNQHMKTLAEKWKKSK